MSNSNTECSVEQGSKNMENKKNSHINNNSNDDIVLFTEEMKSTHKILVPAMLPIHFKLLCELFNYHGYQFEMLENDGPSLLKEGLRNVHNDTCYPATLVVGQILDALKSGKYDTDKVAITMTQTGGGCRASNYINLIRRALKENGFGHIPVLSLNVSSLEKHPGFKLTAPLAVQIIYSIIYADLLMWLSNQARPYEVNEGEVDKLLDTWLARLLNDYKKIINLRLGRVKSNIIQIIKDFEAIERKNIKKPKVGIVGEIYIKFSYIGNNHLEKFLADEGCEVVLPGLLDFIIYCIDNNMQDYKLYGGTKSSLFLSKISKSLMLYFQKQLKTMIVKYSNFVPISQFEEVKALVTDEYVNHGNKMGEGWLLTAEMLELCNMGVYNVICAQPFGCLPNHIVGRGMIKKIKENYPDSNIVAIDYDPSATKVNQENRIKLMLANSK